MSALKLVNLTKKFTQANQDIIALNNINLEVKNNSLTALIGPSGSGKTTLLQIAGLLDKADSGEIFINNIDASKANDSKRTEIRRQNIGFIYQFHHLLPEFSALENVAMPLLIQEKNKDWNSAIETQKKLQDLSSHPTAYRMALIKQSYYWEYLNRPQIAMQILKTEYDRAKKNGEKMDEGVNLIIKLELERLQPKKSLKR
jgi:ABC-type lipoprotein export system ATPase subunit